MENVISVKSLRENLQEYANKVQNGQYFIVFKRSKPLFKISSLEQDLWEEVIDFTQIQKGGVEIEKLLKYL